MVKHSPLHHLFSRVGFEDEKLIEKLRRKSPQREEEKLLKLIEVSAKEYPLQKFKLQFD